MNLFYIFCIFFTIIVIVKCEYSFKRKHNDYNIPKEIECAAVRKTMIDTMTSSICKPHARHVPLKPMPSQEFHPSAVSVNRCDGNCPGHTCVPIKTRMIKVPVKYINQNDRSMMLCALVEIEEHTQCRCKCIHERKDCNDKQYYVEDRCACACKNQESAKYECEAKKWMVWDDTDCSCNCTQQNVKCESGLKWNLNKCECL